MVPTLSTGPLPKRRLWPEPNRLLTAGSHLRSSRCQFCPSIVLSGMRRRAHVSPHHGSICDFLHLTCRSRVKFYLQNGDNVMIVDFTTADEQVCAYGKHKSMGRCRIENGITRNSHLRDSNLLFEDCKRGSLPIRRAKIAIVLDTLRWVHNPSGRGAKLNRGTVSQFKQRFPHVKRLQSQKLHAKGITTGDRSFRTSEMMRSDFDALSTNFSTASWTPSFWTGAPLTGGVPALAARPICPSGANKIALEKSPISKRFR
jgi:hypothetical protein